MLNEECEISMFKLTLLMKLAEKTSQAGKWLDIGYLNPDNGDSMKMAFGHLLLCTQKGSHHEQTV
jgi:hypothetical protein